MPAPARLAEPKYVSATRACRLIGCTRRALPPGRLGARPYALDHFSGRPVYKLSDVPRPPPASLAGLQRTRSSPRPRPRPRPRTQGQRPTQEEAARGAGAANSPPNRSQCHTKRVHLNRFERHHMTSYTLKSARQVLPVSGVACLPMPKSAAPPTPLRGGPPLLGARRCAIFVDSAKHPEQFRRLGPLAVARSPEISGVSNLGILATRVQMCENLGAKRSPRTAANGRGHVPLDATRRDFDMHSESRLSGGQAGLCTFTINSSSRPASRRSGAGHG